MPTAEEDKTMARKDSEAMRKFLLDVREHLAHPGPIDANDLDICAGVDGEFQFTVMRHGDGSNGVFRGFVEDDDFDQTGAEYFRDALVKYLGNLRLRDPSFIPDSCLLKMLDRSAERLRLQ